MKQTILSIILMLLPLLASADAVEIDGIYYNLVKKVKSAEVTSNPNYYSGSVVIPEKVEYEGTEYKVTSIGGSAFYGCSGLTSIAIPNSVTIIGNGAFENCIGLTSVTIPNSVTSIGESAFRYCSNLTSVIIPNSVTYIGNGAFGYCRGLTSLTIGAGIQQINGQAFANCPELTDVFCYAENVPNTAIDAFEGSYIAYATLHVPEASVNIYKTTDPWSGFGTIVGTAIVPHNSVLEVSTSSLSFEYLQSVGQLTVTCDNCWTASSDQSWCTVSPESGTSNGSLTITVSENSTGDTRIAMVTVTDGISTVTVTVKQGPPIGAVDLGLPSGTLWANMNVGASVPEDYGNYFAWGETVPQSDNRYSWDSYKYCIDSESTLTKYCYDSSYGYNGFTDNLTVLLPEDDAATANWGGDWCMPTKAQFDELISNTTYEWTTVNDVNGYKFTSTTNGNSIFLPAAGGIWDDDFYYVDSMILYWSSTLNLDTPNYAWYMNSGDPDHLETTYFGWRRSGKSVRPVRSNTSVVEPTVTLNKSEAILEKGKTMTLKATITPETLADKSVKWKSSNTAVATVTSSGKVKGVKAGFATITCTSNATGESATCQVTVGYVKLDQTDVILEKYKTMTLTPTVYPSKLTDRSVTWKSSDTKVATVTNDGEVKGVKAGFVTITCTSNATGLSTACELTVGYVKLDKTEATLEKGENMTLTPTVYPSKLTDRSVTWKSSDETIATVSSTGEVTGVNAGTTVITCTSNATGLSTTCTVTVFGYVKLDQTEAILQKGKTMTLKATVSPEIDDKSVTWKSSDTKIATVSSTGKVKGVKAGFVTITCTLNATGESATCQVTVGYVKLDKTEAILQKGETMTLTPTVYPSKLTDRSVTWKSSNTAVATVSSAGKVKGVKSGTATITCTSVATGLSTTCTVTVGTVILNLSEIAVNKGRTATLDAMVYPETVTDQSVTWESSDETIATVSSTGKVKGIAAGTATITCTSVATGLSATCTVTVTEFAPARTMLGDDEEVTDIEMVEKTPATEQPFDVYDLKGRKVLQRVTSLDGLPVGVYIINGKKVMKR